MQIIPTQPVPSQNFSITLDGQQMTFNVYQESTGLYLDALLANTPIITGQICEDRELLVQQAYLGFSGDLTWIDTQGTDAPLYTSLGSRWLFVYLEPADLS